MIIDAPVERSITSYHSVRNNQGQLIGFVNSKTMTHSSHKGGTHWTAKNYVTITNKNFVLWNDLNFKQKRGTTNAYLNQTVMVKAYYNHYNGSRYLSLYNNRGTWID